MWMLEQLPSLSNVDVGTASATLKRGCWNSFRHSQTWMLEQFPSLSNVDVGTNRTRKRAEKLPRSVQDGIYAIGKAHMRSTPSLRNCPNVAGSNVRPIVDAGPLSSFEGRSSSASSFHASLLQAIDDVMSLALCPQVASQVDRSVRVWSKYSGRRADVSTM